MADIAFKPAVQLAGDLRSGRIGAAELLEHYLGRIEKHDGAINAVVVRDFERARARARAADEARARGESWGPLHGLPMTVKESYNVAGLPTTWGLPELKGNVATQHSVVAQRFTDAGAVLMGKTNIPRLLADWQSYNEVYGQTNNPFDLGRSPGGSSGGSAAALAAGLTGLESGSDIGGSIRVPAHYCGVYGLKPTWGVIPIRGHAPAPVVTPVDISVVGPLGRSADDLELALDVTAGPDLLMADGWRLDLPRDERSTLGDYRVAVWSDSDLAPVDAAVTGPIQAVAELFARHGALVSDQARPALDPAESHRLYMELLYSVMASRQPDAFIEQAKRKAPTLAPDSWTDEAHMIRGALRPHRDWVGLNEKRNQMRYRWHEFFRDWDVLICPVAPTPTFPHDHSEPQDDRRIAINGKPQRYTNTLFWAGLTGSVYLPAVSAPIARSTAGLPVGLQIVVPELHDRRAIHIARLLARELGGFTPPPAYA